MKYAVLGALLVLPHGLAYGDEQGTPKEAVKAVKAPPATGTAMSKGSSRVHRVIMTLGIPRTLDNNGKIPIIQARIRKAVPGLRACYRAEVSKDLKLKGTVNMRFIVAPHGGVQWAKSNGLNKKVTDCIVHLCS